MIRDREFYKTILRISLPAAFQSLVSFLVVVADDVMVSKLPNAVAAQAAVSQVNSITAFYTATLTGLVSGSSVLISQYWGKKDMARIRRIFSVVLWFCALVSLIFVALARLIPEPIIHLVIGAGEADVVVLALEYFSIACWTYIPFAITTSLIGMLKAAIIGQMGASFMAANSIANNMATLGTLFTSALAGGACVVVGKAVGRGDYDTAREYSKTIQLLFFLIGLVMAALVFLLRVPFTRLYGSSADPEVFSLATTMIAILAVTLIGTCYHASCFVGINRGAGDSRFVAMVDMICGWLVVLPATLLAAFVFHWPLPVVFLCTRIDQCFKWIIAFIRLRGDKWIRNVTRESAAS